MTVKVRPGADNCIQVINESGTADFYRLLCLWHKRLFFLGVSMVTFYHFMKNCFNFKGKSSRSEFFLSFISFVFFSGLIRILEFNILVDWFKMSLENANSFSVFSVFFVIAVYSLSCRRLRDAGYSERVLRWITFPFGPTIAFFVSFIPNEIK